MHPTCICVCSSCRKQIKFGPQIQFMSLTDCAEIESTPYPDLHSHLLSFFLGIFFPDSMFALVESSLCAYCLACALCPSISQLSCFMKDSENARELVYWFIISQIISVRVFLHLFPKIGNLY